MELMQIAMVQPGSEITEEDRRRRRFFPGRAPLKKDRTDHKVIGFALEKIHSPDCPPSLLATAEAPKIVHGLLSEFFFQPQAKKKDIQLIRSKNPFPNLEDPLGDKIPIGIRKCAYNSWINALIQFVMFIPSLSEMFIYTSHSLTPFLDFIESYKRDQLQGKKIAFSSSRKLVEGLRRKFPKKQFKQADLFETLESIMRSIYDEDEDDESSDLLALHPNWRMQFSRKEGHFEKRVEAKLRSLIHRSSSRYAPTELLIGVSSDHDDEGFIKRKLSLFKGEIIYELEAFVEYRKEGVDEGQFITYLQIDHSWFQCDDTRITRLRSMNLSIALKRSILFYYRSPS